MPDPIFERYKEALRAGHVAALRGRPDDALLQYRTAAAIAPDRALPHLGMAEVLLRLGRHEDALVACNVALRLAPLDESGLDLAARVHAAAGRGGDAAAQLDRLVALREQQGRAEDALAIAIRAQEADPTDARRNRLAALRSIVDAERARLTDPGWAPAVEIAEPPVTEAAVATPPPAPEPSRPTPQPPSRAAAPPRPASAQATAAEPVPPGAVAPETGAETAMPASTAHPTASPEPPAPASPEPLAPAMPKPPAPPSSAPEPSLPPAVDPGERFVAAEEQVAGGDPAAAARLYVEAADLYLAMGAADTAVDACLRALAGAPGDTDVHLALARIDVATGHQGRAVERLDLLERLLSLEGDEDGMARVTAFTERVVSAPGGPTSRRRARHGTGG